MPSQEMKEEPTQEAKRKWLGEEEDRERAASWNLRKDSFKERMSLPLCKMHRKIKENKSFENITVSLWVTRGQQYHTIFFQDVLKARREGRPEMLKQVTEFISKIWFSNLWKPS